MKALYLIAAAFLTACSYAPRERVEPMTFATATVWEQDEELNGRPLPLYCQRDLSHVQLPVFLVPPRELAKLYRIAGEPAAAPSGVSFSGRRAAAAGVRPGIYLNEAMQERVIEIVTHHERCRALLADASLAG